MACVLQWWCCALFFVLITVFSDTECRRSGGGGGRRVSIRRYTYSSGKAKPSYHSSGASSTSRRYPGYPIHQGHGGYAAFPGGYGPGAGGFERFTSGFQPTHRGAAFDSSTLWLSLLSLQRDVNHYHFYYPNSSPAKNIPATGSFSTQVGNMTCISIYNATAVTKWAADTMNELNKLFRNAPFSVNGNGTRKGLNLTVVPGEIVHNETLGVTCCGTAKGIVNLAVLTSGTDSDVNCMFRQFNMPFRKLRFILINSAAVNGTAVNNTTSTTNATAITPNSNSTTATNITVAPDSNSTTTVNTNVALNSNNTTATNTTFASNSNSTTATNTVLSNNTDPITTQIRTSDNSTSPDARKNTVLPTVNITTVVPTNATTKTAETTTQNIKTTTNAS